jgi:uncharacterized protein (TIGR00106 family)
LARVIVDFTSSPVGIGTSLSSYVRKAVQIVEKSGLKTMTHPMGTIIEGDSLEQIFNIIRQAHESIFEAGAARVITSIKIDERRDKSRTMEEKVQAVTK